MLNCSLIRPANVTKKNEIAKFVFNTESLKAGEGKQGVGREAVYEAIFPATASPTKAPAIPARAITYVFIVNLFCWFLLRFGGIIASLPA